MTQNERLKFLINYLVGEHEEYGGISIPTDIGGQKRLYRALVNVREPSAIDEEYLRIEDEFLQHETQSKGITDTDGIAPVFGGMCLWQGDITTLKCDAVVNAANSGMTGCYFPNHSCIDNAIHTFAGVRLRLRCAEIMRKHGAPERTGGAVLTPAFNLPCRFVLHTVGPVIGGAVRRSDREQLRECYLSCLETAEQNRLESVAFCCISTGEYRFPNEQAAEIAVDTVGKSLQKSRNVKKVIFDVYKDIDREIYERLLGKAEAAQTGALRG